MGIHFIKDTFDYKAEAQRIKEYYEAGEKDERLKWAIESLAYDEYHDIIVMYYKEGLTWEKIANFYDVDIGTIFRNRKRLLREIHRRAYLGKEILQPRRKGAK